MNSKPFELEKTISDKEFKIIQNIMSQISSEQLALGEQKPGLDIERMKSIVAKTYETHHNIILSKDDLDRYFAPYEKETDELLVLEDSQPLIKENDLKITHKFRKTSVLRLSWFQKTYSYLFGKYYPVALRKLSAEKRELIVFDYMPLNDDEVVSEVNHILDVENNEFSPLLCSTLLSAFFTLTSLLAGVVKVPFAWLVSGAFFSIFMALIVVLVIRASNHKKLILGLRDWEEKRINTTACRTMFAMIQPLNVNSSLNQQLPNLKKVTPEEINSYSTYGNIRRRRLFQQWIKEGKTIRDYDLDLLYYI